jgi:hypothetical protein
MQRMIPARKNKEEVIEAVLFAVLMSIEENLKNYFQLFFEFV